MLSYKKDRKPFEYLPAQGAPCTGRWRRAGIRTQPIPMDGLPWLYVWEIFLHNNALCTGTWNRTDHPKSELPVTQINVTKIAPG